MVKPTHRRRNSSAWRQASLFVLLPLLAVVSFFGIRAAFGGESKEHGAKQQSLASALSAAAQSPTANQDSDQDGLLDWQEAVYRTSAMNPDSDGDGTPDGEEITLGRDPSKPGPDDPLGSLDINAIGTPIDGVAGQNLTVSFLSQVVTGFTGQIDAGGELNAEQSQSLLVAAEQLDSQLALGIPEAHRSDLVLIQTNDPGEIKKYFNDVATMYTTVFPSFARNESGILTPSPKTASGADAASAEGVSQIINEAARAFKVKPVPQPYADFALAELNYLLALGRITTILRNVESDPLAGIIAVGELQVQTKNIETARQATLAKLQSQSIAFGAAEPAYAFLNP